MEVNNRERFRRTETKRASSNGVRMESESLLGAEATSLGSSITSSADPSFEGLFLERTESKGSVLASYVGELMKEMDLIGERLKKNASLEDFFSYKRVLKNLFSKVLPSTYTVEKSYDRPSFHKPLSKELHIVKIVDESLDSLLKMIKTNQKQSISIASKVIQIKGLIVNLLK